MPLGHLLWVSWICFLLFDGSSGLPAIKGYGYPYIAESRNVGDDAEDEVLTSPTFDQSNWQASNNQPTDPVYTSYNKPLAAQQPDWVPSQQNLPNTPSAPDVERLVNGDPRDWGLDDLNKPLLFPLSPDYRLSTPAMPATHYAGPPAYYKPAPSSTSQATKPPSIESWQPEPVGSGYGVADLNTDFSAAGGDSSNVPHLVYEDIFQYLPEPSQSYGTLSDTAEGYGQADHMSEGSSTGYASTLEERSFPSYPTNVGAQPVYPSGMGSPSSSFPGGENLNSGQTDYQPRDEISWSRQKPVASTQTVEVPQRLSDSMLPPQSYIVQSRNGYQQHRSGDTPELPPQMPVNSNGVEGPAPSQPDAPKGVNLKE